MDEIFQLWGYKAVPGFYMFVDEGRYLTEELIGWLTKKIDTIHDMMYLRWFSLFGWMLCLPVWYAIIKKETDNVPQYKYLPFFTCLYLITNPSFLVAVQWSSCLQFFISDTACVLAGALVINSLRSKDKVDNFLWASFFSLLLGVPAMFLYQGSWACFLIPFLLYFVNPLNSNKDKVLIRGAIVHFAVYAAYFVVYKASFLYFFNGIPEDPRNKVYIDPFGKMAFFLARPLERSFRFTLLTEETSPFSKVWYALSVLSMGLLTLKRFGKEKRVQAVKHLAILFFGFGIVSYLPGLLIKENFNSNRTMFALNLVVFIYCLEMALFYIKNKLFLQIGGAAVMVFFIFCGRFNFYQGFARPLTEETTALKDYFKEHYNSNIKTVHWIRPDGDAFVKKFHINRSMDEYGMPSSLFVWVPDPMSKQLVYEITGNRQLASSLQIKQWPNENEYKKSGEKADSSVLVVDTKEIIANLKP
ncbi:hypothetical protein A4H97_21760 [Niastella yeongjuensis]|uniref:Glycosyltransferase RgtA/B/C/D-like domain-containing protein n=1 Tax=Niastella yeongjuensis TaxID=354355 RepID=A0A1V9F8P9_9BACT|nr:hypothetical protein [Niastella yeongjuensis]OQP54596.1 hypothetical protein A4H97_21760 [Niastella yeongjuensis]